ncbi:hypothetical protein LAH08_02112 [Micromonospora noduli]|uniref:Uncharacterized protein n=1 Tax=Micromonospora noduli TaxID=709876 RepID=A0A328N4R7_9ACTN|nr:hypothetical protein LAH08_02112 [Micromonospora noduli]
MEKPPRRSVRCRSSAVAPNADWLLHQRVNQSQKKPQSLWASGTPVQSFGVSLGRSCSGSARAAAAASAGTCPDSTSRSNTYDRRATALSASPLIGSSLSGERTRPASSAAWARVSSAGEREKYRLLAAAMPYAPAPK